MKKMLIFLLVFVLGGISGVIVQYRTSGAADRAKITALEDELKARNDRLDKCTDALINGLRPRGQTPAPPATAPK